MENFNECSGALLDNLFHVSKHFMTNINYALPRQLWHDHYIIGIHEP